MGTKLVAYESVPSGFEMVIDKNQVKAWNLWWNTKLTDDPEAWDDGIRSINRMQSKLGSLTEGQRLIRAQMAEFCRYSPSFPRSVDILCEEIGESRFHGPIVMGCEGRGLLDSLVERRSGHVWKDTLKLYSIALSKWIDKKKPNTALESKVFGLLGRRADEKQGFVKKLVSAIASDEPSVQSLSQLSREVCRETHSGLEVPKDRPFNCFSCTAGSVEKEAAPECRCCYGMFVDAFLLCVGSYGESNLSTGEFRRFAEESVLVYSYALNSWLCGRRSNQIASQGDLRYFDDDREKEVAHGVHTSLGEKSSPKEWLTACLLKTLTANQRWHGRRELIDEHPEAMSWLSENLAL